MEVTSGGSTGDAGLKIAPTFPPALVFTGFSADRELILAQDDSFRERVCRLTARESPCTCTRALTGSSASDSPPQRRADGNRLCEADVP